MLNGELYRQLGVAGQLTCCAPWGLLVVHSIGNEARDARCATQIGDGIVGAAPAPATGRERMVAAAIELFYRHGFGAVGIDQVIAEAGVTKTTFYKHFEGKGD